MAPRSRRRAAPAVAGALAICSVLFGGVSPALAGVGVGAPPDIGPDVVVGQTVPAAISIRNANTSDEAALADTVDSITLVPSCGTLAAGPDCPPEAVDPGVLRPATAVGRPGTSCGGVTFTVSLVDLVQGKYVFTAPAPVLVGPGSAPAVICVIDFTMDVGKMPTKDASPLLAGMQTDLASLVTVRSGALSAASAGSDLTTVTKGVPAIAAQVAPAQIPLGASFRDTATLTARPVAAPPTGTVRFDVYGPGDTSCTGSPVSTSTKPVNASTSAVSDDFTPAAAGTYRVRATYGGDQNYDGSSTGCNNPAEVVVVAAAPPPRPNIVVVMTDDQDVEQMGALRRVRRLIGERGTTFTRNFSTFPLCCPSRATFLTGQYSHNHRVRGNGPPAVGGFYKLDSSNTLPVWLSAAGYATAHIGKYLNGYGTPNPGQGLNRAKAARLVPAGWQEWIGSVDPTTYDYRSFCLNDDGRLVRYGPVPRSACPRPTTQRRATYQGDLYSRLAVGYIRRRAPSVQPFFLSVAYLAPHGGGPNDGGRCVGSAKPAARHRGRFANATLPRPPSFNERDVSDKPVSVRGLPRLDAQEIRQIRLRYQCRRASLLAVDEGVERMVQALRSAGELDQTLFVFTSDNGFFHGEHRVPGGKFKVYEPSVRVPALIAGPGVPRNRRVNQLTGNIDLASTIVKAARATPGLVQDGVSLVDVANAPQAYAGRAILLANGPTGPVEHPQYHAIRTGRYKYVEYVTGERELYDLQVDPFEQRSVHRVRRYRDIRAQLATRLRSLRTCAGATCR